MMCKQGVNSGSRCCKVPCPVPAVPPPPQTHPQQPLPAAARLPAPSPPPHPQENAVARLERLFAAADDIDAASTSDPDSVPPDFVLDVPPPTSSAAGRSSAQEGGAGDAAASSSGSEGGEGGSRQLRRSKSALREYVETFDQAAMVDTARIVSTEGAALVERQTSALFGDIKQLTAQMQVRPRALFTLHYWCGTCK